MFILGKKKHNKGTCLTDMVLLWFFTISGKDTSQENRPLKKIPSMPPIKPNLGFLFKTLIKSVGSTSPLPQVPLEVLEGVAASLEIT